MITELGSILIVKTAAKGSLFNCQFEAWVCRAILAVSTSMSESEISRDSQGEFFNIGYQENNQYLYCEEG